MKCFVVVVVIVIVHSYAELILCVPLYCICIVCICNKPYSGTEVIKDYIVTVPNPSEGLNYTDKGFNGAEPGKSYTANYTGSNKDGAIVNGKITVYTYQATDKVYVFDYGLESNIAETNDNHDGLFEGGTFYNDNAKDAYETTAKLNQITHEKDNNPQTTITPDQDVIINKKGSAKGAVTFKPIQLPLY